MADPFELLASTTSLFLFFPTLLFVPLLRYTQLCLKHWLASYVPVAANLSDEGAKALAYLSKHTALGMTDYPRFKRLGLENIASALVEAANKSVIGARLNLSGAIWSSDGAFGMVQARADSFSFAPIVPFLSLRHSAFPSFAA